MSDDELKLTRRHFLRQSAVATATGGIAAMVLRTDAAVKSGPVQFRMLTDPRFTDYNYQDPP